MLIRYQKPALAAAGLLVVALTAVHHLSTPDATASQHSLLLPTPYVGTRVAAAESLTASVAPVASPVGLDARSLAQRDPRALARLGRERYEGRIRDYRCVFLKQERVKDKLGEVEEIEVRYREEPTTVYMIWKRNASQAKRVLFIDTAEFLNDEGEKVARVEPAGAIIRLIVSDILMPIHGKKAHETSRRSIDEFGFKATLDLLDRYNRLAEQNGKLDFHYAGEGEIDGRPTHVLVRYLPYNGPDGIYPDAKMVLHLDQEWLLPTAVYSYADREGKVLLGSYVHTKVELNPGLGAEAFKF